ncbi:unnamed protein product [Gongylonema pulchrum]|uniref:Uncharacterized protein n=1 Tax=Gongylonema pulchrum TaxID=637853 RepID=A0A183EHY7_9BILA|nr:unnamed protein product [Gongylonema pulchrum]
MVIFNNYVQTAEIKRISEMLVRFREECNDTLAEMAEIGIAPIDRSIYELVDRHNYFELCLRNITELDAGRIFLWRCLCEFIHKSCLEAEDFSDSLHFLLPDFCDFADFIHNALIDWKAPEYTNAGVIEAFSVYQLCLITRAYKEKGPSEM